ncbi:MAG: DNA repair protein RecN [Actinomycetota bacterium]|nr:DNA repair protein RecN [Actinomycetota bacterium]
MALVLSDLRVRGLGVIDDVSLRFGPGMTAVTGETGAGKTLLVEALQLVLGGQAAPGIVRDGTREALVEVRFGDDGSGDDGSEVVLARSLPAAGRSRAWRDGRMVPLAAAAELGARLVDIHGQHDHQSLFSVAAQRRTLDAYAGAGAGAESDRRREARRELRDLDADLALLGGDEEARRREAEVLEYQLAEINRAAITGPDEEDALRAERDHLAGLEERRSAVRAVLAVLDGEPEAGAAGEPLPVALLLARAVEAIGAIEAFQSWEERLRAAAAELTDLASDLRRASESWEDDPHRLEEVQQRLRLLAELRRKYGATLSEVLGERERFRRRLEELEQAGAFAADLLARRSQVERSLVAAENELGKLRRSAAPELARDVEARLRTLGMPMARFEVAVGGPAGSGDDGSEGSSADRAGDRVRFLFGANPGEPVQELARVASGGELSRTMLAIRLVALDGPGTVVFDEVDAGVGGEAARALASSLQELATRRQVLVVTHLPQVAAAADHHVTVAKVVTTGRTLAQVRVLSPAERVIEVSRMLSGHPDSPTARAHAEELLAAAGRDRPSTTKAGLVD